MNVAAIRMGTATEAGAGNEVSGDAVACRQDEGILVVADGMGGRPGGPDASSSAVCTFVSEIRAVPPSERLDEALLQQAVLRVHDRVRQLALRDPKLTGLGTTLTGLVLVGTRGKIVHVGDSRAYRHRDHELRQLTVDHTLVAELVARRYVDTDQAGDYPLRHVLTNVLGGNRTPRVDVFDVSLKPSDVLLLVTDGFWESAGEERMARILNQADENADAAALCDMLMAVPGDSRSADDRTVAVVQLVRQENEAKNCT